MSTERLLAVTVLRDTDYDGAPAEALVHLTVPVVALIRKLHQLFRTAKAKEPTLRTMRFDAVGLAPILTFVDPIETDSLETQINDARGPNELLYELKDNGPLVLDDAEDLEYEPVEVGDVVLCVADDGFCWQAFFEDIHLTTDEITFNGLDHLFPNPAPPARKTKRR